jgi:hypothetical protein
MQIKELSSSQELSISSPIHEVPKSLD